MQGNDGARRPPPLLRQNQHISVLTLEPLDGSLTRYRADAAVPQKIWRCLFGGIAADIHCKLQSADKKPKFTPQTLWSEPTLLSVCMMDWLLYSKPLVRDEDILTAIDGQILRNLIFNVLKSDQFVYRENFDLLDYLKNSRVIASSNLNYNLEISPTIASKTTFTQTPHIIQSLPFFFLPSLAVLLYKEEREEVKTKMLIKTMITICPFNGMFVYFEFYFFLLCQMLNTMQENQDSYVDLAFRWLMTTPSQNFIVNSAQEYLKSIEKRRAYFEKDGNQFLRVSPEQVIHIEQESIRRAYTYIQHELDTLVKTKRVPSNFKEEKFESSSYSGKWVWESIAIFMANRSFDACVRACPKEERLLAALCGQLAAAFYTDTSMIMSKVEGERKLENAMHALHKRAVGLAMMEEEGRRAEADAALEQPAAHPFDLQQSEAGPQEMNPAARLSINEKKRRRDSSSLSSNMARKRGSTKSQRIKNPSNTLPDIHEDDSPIAHLDDNTQNNSDPTSISLRRVSDFNGDAHSALVPAQSKDGRLIHRNSRSQNSQSTAHKRVLNPTSLLYANRLFTPMNTPYNYLLPSLNSNYQNLNARAHNGRRNTITDRRNSDRITPAILDDSHTSANSSYTVDPGDYTVHSRLDDIQENENNLFDWIIEHPLASSISLGFAACGLAIALTNSKWTKKKIKDVFDLP